MPSWAEARHDRAEVVLWHPRKGSVMGVTSPSLPAMVLLSIHLLTWLPGFAPIARAQDARPAYPPQATIDQRADLLLRGVAESDLSTWRRGYFSGGDPGKYLPLHAMAKLKLGLDRENVIRYMNDQRSHKEHYHFAALNWARFLPTFADVLSQQTRAGLGSEAGRYSGYLSGGGTENHKTMWMTSACVLPSYIDGDRFGGRPKAEALDEARRQLRAYVKGLYAAGQGEWDSSTYLMFGMHGMLNIHDFAKDEEARRLAGAALAWYSAAYALKYSDGLYCGPNQRGFYTRPMQSIADQSGWLWWGSTKRVATQDVRGWRYAVIPALSGWRPDPVIDRIARRQVRGLPVEMRNTKPNYWHGLGQQPRTGAYRETLYIDRDLTLGTLWNGHGSQITRLQLAVATPEGPVSITGGNPRKSDHQGKKTGIGYGDGIDRYTQYAAMGPIVVSMSLCPPDDAEAAFSFIRLPEGVTPKRIKGQRFDGWVMHIGERRIGVQPLGGEMEFASVPGDQKSGDIPILRVPAISGPGGGESGKRSGFVLMAMPIDNRPDALALEQIRIDAARFASEMSVEVTDAAGRTLNMRFNPAGDDDAHGNRPAEATIDGKTIDWPEGEVYGGPMVRQKHGVLIVSDGGEGFTIDFSGDTPIHTTISQ